MLRAPARSAPVRAVAPRTAPVAPPAQPPRAPAPYPAERQRHAELAERDDVAHIMREQAHRIETLRQENQHLRDRIARAQDSLQQSDALVRLQRRSLAALQQEVQSLADEREDLHGDVKALATAASRSDALATQRGQALAELQVRAGTLQQRLQQVTASRDEALQRAVRAGRFLLVSGVSGCVGAALGIALRQTLFQSDDEPTALAPRLIDLAAGLSAGIGLVSWVGRLVLTRQSGNAGVNAQH